MNRTHIIAAIALAVVVLFGTSAAVVTASDVLADQEFNASQSQSMTTECTYGSYGQSSTCKASGSQSQSISGRQIVYAPQVLGASKIHVPVDTAADPAAMALLLTTGLTGIGAFAGYLKLR